MSDVIAKTEKSLTIVSQAVRALESGDKSTGYRLFGEVKRSGVSIIKETEYLLERVSAVEKHYRELESGMTTRVNELYNLEQASKKKRDDKSFMIKAKESDLRQAKQDLASAEEGRRRARIRREEAESSKNANIVGAVGFGIVTVLTLGLAAPLTVPGTAVCVANAVNASNDEDEAERDMQRNTTKISECNSEISHYRREINQLDRELATLSQEIQSKNLERDRIHAQRGETSDSIKYLHDVLQFWKEFSVLTEHGTKRAIFAQKLAALLEINKSSTVLRQLQSCTDAWGKVEKKIEHGVDYVFKIDFSCEFCCNSFHSLPHLSHGNFCCTSCYTIHS